MERIAARQKALPLDAGMVWKESTTRFPDIYPAGLLVPSRPVLWAIGLAHLQKHSFSSLAWFVDLVRLTSQMPEIEIVHARELADHLRLTAAASVFDCVVSGCWGGSVATGLISDLQALEKKTRRLVDSACRDVTALRDPGLVGERLLWHMAPGPLNRLRLIWESAYPSHRVMLEIYPAYRPLLRPWYMLRRTVALAGRMLKR
jgi:hypothetical protein